MYEGRTAPASCAPSGVPWKPPKNVGIKKANPSTMSRSNDAGHPSVAAPNIPGRRPSGPHVYLRSIFYTNGLVIA